jgi:threonine dehydratase
VIPTPEDVERARAVVADRIEHTPTLHSAALGVWLKAELFQRTGSFKARGALNRLAALTPEERERGVVTWSAGNHAQAVAWAAAEAGVDCLVQMW